MHNAGYKLYFVKMRGRDIGRVTRALWEEGWRFTGEEEHIPGDCDGTLVARSSDFPRIAKLWMRKEGGGDQIVHITVNGEGGAYETTGRMEAFEGKPGWTEGGYLLVPRFLKLEKGENPAEYLKDKVVTMNQGKLGGKIDVVTRNFEGMDMWQVRCADFIAHKHLMQEYKEAAEQNKLPKHNDITIRLVGQAQIARQYMEEDKEKVEREREQKVEQMWRKRNEESPRSLNIQGIIKQVKQEDVEDLANKFGKTTFVRLWEREGSNFNGAKVVFEQEEAAEAFGKHMMEVYDGWGNIRVKFEEQRVYGNQQREDFMNPGNAWGGRGAWGVGGAWEVGGVCGGMRTPILAHTPTQFPQSALQQPLTTTSHEGLKAELELLEERQNRRMDQLMGVGGGSKGDQNAQLLKLGVEMAEKYEDNLQKLFEVATGPMSEAIKLAVISTLQKSFEGYTTTIRDMINKFDTTTVSAATAPRITIKDKSSSEEGSLSGKEEEEMSVSEEEEEERKKEVGEGQDKGKEKNEGGKRKGGSPTEGKEGGGEGGKTKERGKKKKVKDAQGGKNA
jgi:hypothetical protein